MHTRGDEGCLRFLAARACLRRAERRRSEDEAIATLQVLENEVKRKTIVEWLRNWKNGALQFHVEIREQAIHARHTRESAARLAEEEGR